ncbi:glycosyltransferase family 1 protein [Mucilaginibacter mali]|uniref:Glycosyltransferase family 1 protein n=1 Tax=Mucilaginibacter mali TaxID=2740462 RepID=A0A7D4UDQ4_9SPHI|nr:glycosyltransferase family 1 protein [Mucilaginibacter mali]QKJ30859.1 glycosyltransferase family 1 protein [Mucilaginibacter mali]
MKKTKVVFFAEILVEEHDGATRTMFQLIRRIPHADFEFLFICGVGPNTVYGFECMRLPTLTLPINKTYKMVLPALAAHSLREKLDSFNPDVVHIATPALLGEFAVKYARQRALPVISIYHTHFISYIDYYLKKAPFLIDFAKAKIISGQRAFYNQCDAIYVPSESMITELSDIGIESYRMKIWKRGIDTQLFSPAKRNSDMMRKLTGNKHPVILFASRLVWEKNLETLFGIYDGLKDRGVKFNMLIAGDGIARKACETRMPDAIFTGKVDHANLSILYASADVFLFPSVSETYGNVVPEAMASGLPCVIADGGGSKDFIEQGVNGFRCSAYMISDYVSKLELLLADERLQQQFSARGIVYSKTFGWDQLATSYFEDLLQLTGQSEETVPLKAIS